MSEIELNDIHKELQLAYNYFGAMLVLSVGEQTQEQTLENLQMIANIANIQISSIDDFLEKYQEIEASLRIFPKDKDTLLQQLKQMLPQVQHVYNALRVSE